MNPRANNLRLMGFDLFERCRNGAFGDECCPLRARMQAYATWLYEAADEMDDLSARVDRAARQDRQVKRWTFRSWLRRMLPRRRYV